MGGRTSDMGSEPIHGKECDEGWIMYVDFTDINKACPKDYYPLPEIDWKVESLSGFHLQSFLDAYKGCHQIQMAEEDEDKTTFFVREGVYCYRKIPLLVDKVFNDQTEINLEAYVDDMVIKSTSEEDMLADIKETFQRFRSINMKLNPKKCSFGVEEGLFLGHLIAKQVIQANPSKWTQEAAAALQEMKKFLETLPTLTAPIHGEVLMMYLAASTESINAALFARRENGQQNEQSNWESMTSCSKQGMTATKKWQNIFLIKSPPEDNRKEVKRKTDTKLEETKLSYKWKLYTDGASSSDCSGAGLMMIDPKANQQAIIEYLQRTKETLRRITKKGYYWSSMHRDVSRIIQDFEKSKEQSTVKKRAEIRAIAVGNAWLFSHWGVNVLGTLSTAPEGLKLLAVAIEHSTKWIEAKPLTTGPHMIIEVYKGELYKIIDVSDHSLIQTANETNLRKFYM
uniref:Reverse transcriptase domain-containing protein n=1 Tax=Tanacetum cinerariifolium TaxID=118510 RepID=A0A6L2JMM0_TANCI|nr:hypothetical protein [Tanacetum cinerariifolium]